MAAEELDEVLVESSDASEDESDEALVEVETDVVEVEAEVLAFSPCAAILYIRYVLLEIEEMVDMNKIPFPSKNSSIRNSSIKNQETLSLIKYIVVFCFFDKLF